MLVVVAAAVNTTLGLATPVPSKVAVSPVAGPLAAVVGVQLVVTFQVLPVPFQTGVAAQADEPVRRVRQAVVRMEGKEFFMGKRLAGSRQSPPTPGIGTTVRLKTGLHLWRIKETGFLR